jgi:hypothetical protein
LEYLGFRPKNVPVGLTYPILTFPAVNSGEIERTVDVCIRVSEVKEPMEWKKLVAFGINLIRVGRAN